MKNEQEYAKSTFDEVAHKYDEIPFFKISAKHVVEMISNHTNKKDLEVLDVACGTGNVVLECAAAMTESTFDAMDISEAMLSIAKEKAKKENLHNIEFSLQDVTKLSLDKKYHLITCSYALFFLPDAPKVLKKLVSLLRPNGIVVFTTFTVNAFAPASDILLSLLEKYGSALAKEHDANKWENLKERKDISRLCALSYVNDMKIHMKEIGYGLSIDAWWDLFNNTGYKGMLMELSEENYEKCKEEFYTALFKHADMDGEVQLNADTYFVEVC